MSDKLKVHLVNYEKGRFNGILSKYTKMMKKHLKKMCDVTVSDKPDPKADVNHHINYLPYQHVDTKNTMMITHIFSGYKYIACVNNLEKADMGICFSTETEEDLIEKGLPAEKLCTVLPAQDARPRRRTIIAILTNVYPDGCKRAEMLIDLVKSIDKDKFAFRIMGKDWTDILTPLVADGLQVDYFSEFDEESYKAILDSSDYYLYFGNDEGSMGTLDAMQAGLKTIVTDQGFHRDIKIDYPYKTQRQLNNIFKKLAVNHAEHLTWESYAQQHYDIWKNL